MLCFREIDRQRKEEKRNEKKRGGAGGGNEEGGDGSHRAKTGRGRAPLARALRGDVAEAAGSSPSPIPAVFLLHSRLFLPASPPPPPPQRGNTIFSFFFLFPSPTPRAFHPTPRPGLVDRSLLHAYGLRICVLQEPPALNRLARLFTSQAVTPCFLSNICIAVRFGSIISCSSRVSNRFTGISCFSREVMVAIPRSRSLLSS